MVQFSLLPPEKLESEDWFQALTNRVCTPFKSLANAVPEELDDPPEEEVELELLDFAMEEITF